MVHALSEIRRTLIPGGMLIDVRPLAGSWPVEVTTARKIDVAGTVVDLPSGPADDHAANATLAKAEGDGWFRRLAEENFPLSYYWDSPSEMLQYLEEEWSDFASLDAGTQSSVRAKWAIADADARVRIRMNMLITRWEKVG